MVRGSLLHSGVTVKQRLIRDSDGVEWEVSVGQVRQGMVGLTFQASNSARAIHVAGLPATMVGGMTDDDMYEFLEQHRRNFRRSHE